MKNRIIIIAGVINIVLISVICDLFSSKKELAIERQNLIEKYRYYRNKDSCSVASIAKLTLTQKELREQNNANIKLIKDLGLKLRRVEAVASQNINATYRVKAQLIENKSLDSLQIKMDGADQCEKVAIDNNRALICGTQNQGIDQYQIRYVDNYIDIHGKVHERQKMVELEINTYDTLVQIVHRVPRRFLCFRFGTKAIRQEIVSRNPYAKIVYAEYVELK